MYNHNKAQQSKNRVHISWGILYLPHYGTSYGNPTIVCAWTPLTNGKWCGALLLPLLLASANFNTLRPRQNGHLFADDTFKRIFLNENIRISIKISLKFVPKCLINDIPALVLIMAWRRTGDKPLSEPMLARLPTHICVTRPQWVNTNILRTGEMRRYNAYANAIKID